MSISHKNFDDFWKTRIEGSNDFPTFGNDAKVNDREDHVGRHIAIPDEEPAKPEPRHRAEVSGQTFSDIVLGQSALRRTVGKKH